MTCLYFISTGLFLLKDNIFK